ncbi:MAG: class I SAM-dependent methyltransferase [bacterium]
MRLQESTLTIASPKDKALPWYQRRLIERLRQLQMGCLDIALPDQAAIRIQGAEPGPAADISIHHPRKVLWRLFWRGDLGFAEAFMAGEWTSRQPAKLLELFAHNLDAYADSNARHRLVKAMTYLRHRLNRNSLRGSRRNIAAHYDLGNDFYSRWLDSSMTYSAALFDASDDLTEAQQRKYQRMLEISGAQPGQHILEIGCGWGGFALYAAQQGMRVTGLTLSKEQLAFARQRIAKAGFADRVEFKLCDYREFDQQVDHIVSIEMFEAVGQAYWPTYFATLERCLRPGGRAALQVITIDEAHFEEYVENAGGFIQTYIFPGGMLPTQQHLQQLTHDAGLGWQGLHAFGRDYADTLAHWHQRFDQCTDWLEDNGYDRRFRRMWRYYLAFCEAGFRAGQIDVVQCVLEKNAR